MTNRPASPPPAAHWKFRLGMILSVAIGATLLLTGPWPPPPIVMVLVLVCFALGLFLFLAPYLSEYEARVRIAEAHVREHLDGQLRHLKQTTEQLTNAISRSQSSEEQAGQALGSIEELAEKLNSQADELAQALARSNEREIAALRADVSRLVSERDERLAALDQRLDTVTGQLSEHQLSTRKSAGGFAKTLEELRERMIALAGQIEELTPAAASSAPTRARTVDHAPVATTIAPAAENHPPVAAAVAAEVTKEISPEAVSSGPAATAVPVAPVVTPESGATAAPVPPPAAKPRVRRAPATPTPMAAPVAGGGPTSLPVSTPTPAPKESTPAPAASRIPSRPQPLELPLLDLGETQPVAPTRSESSAGASTLVATAYIGIGNKLYVRGDGPGLSWDHGVPMQFLAIGKWGWTSPGADGPITCRIYRNDDTPMLDENITIAPGTKTEITPRF